MTGSPVISRAELPKAVERPVAALAMDAEAATNVFPPELMSRLGRCVDITPGPPLARFQATPGLADVRILITGWGCPRIDARALDAMPGLTAVVHAAGTVKPHLDDAVWERGIVVSSAAAANAGPVADYTVAVCVLAAKRVFFPTRSYLDGRPDTARYGLNGATVGIVGASRIGRLVIAGLRRHSVHILVSDPYLSRAEADSMNVELADLETLCRRSDIVSLHAPELPQTRHLIDQRHLSLMKPGTLLINTARGSLIDTDALVEHCASGRIDAVLDVTEPEPLPPAHPLLHMPNVLLTPHLAGAMGRELPLLGAYAVNEIERLLTGRRLRGEVTAADLPRIA